MNLFENEHKTPAFRAVNPLGEFATKNFELIFVNSVYQVPALQIDNHLLSESLAIIEYLEERSKGDHSGTLLLGPENDPFTRSLIRRISLQIVSGIQPFQKLKVCHLFPLYPCSHFDFLLYSIC